MIANIFVERSGWFYTYHHSLVYTIMYILVLSTEYNPLSGFQIGVLGLISYFSVCRIIYSITQAIICVWIYVIYE